MVTLQPMGSPFLSPQAGMRWVESETLKTTGLSGEEAQVGLDLKYLVSPNVTVDLTVNPDFAQVEADDVRPQAELGHDGEQVIKDIGLYRLIIGPGLIITEDINLDRESVLGRFKMPDEERHILMYFGIIFQVGNNICTKDPDIGLAPAIYQLGSISFMFFVVPVYFFLFVCNILLD